MSDALVLREKGGLIIFNYYLIILKNELCYCA